MIHKHIPNENFLRSSSYRKFSRHSDVFVAKKRFQAAVVWCDVSMMGVCNDFFQQLYHTSMWYSCYLIIRKLIRPVKTPHLEFLSVMYVRNVINCTRPSCIVDLILRPHHSSLMSHLSSHHPPFFASSLYHHVYDDAAARCAAAAHSHSSRSRTTS